MAYSVFDVASRLFKLSEVVEIPAISLQKIMYFSFGWYGRLTGEKLFTQHFYAMEHGPVVGELLTLHKYHKMVDRDLVEQGRDIIKDPVSSDDDYLDIMLKAIWNYYGGLPRWTLVDMTHQDAPWIDAWHTRREGSKRADLDSDVIIEYYLKRTDVPPELRRCLPDPRITFVLPKDLERIEAQAADSSALAREQFRKAGLLP